MGTIAKVIEDSERFEAGKKRFKPVITGTDPELGYPGAMIKILGRNFSPRRIGNRVTIDGKPAIVYEATPKMLKVISDPNIQSGKIRVQVGKYSADHEMEFMHGLADTTEQALFSTAMKISLDKNQPSKGYNGSLNVLVVLVRPKDVSFGSPTDSQTAADMQAAYTDVSRKWDSVMEYYRQVSYGALTVKPTIARQMNGDWFELSGNTADYIVWENATEAPNIKWGVRERFWSEVANIAKEKGYNLDDFHILTGVIFLARDDVAIRGYGGFSTAEFKFGNIDIPVHSAGGFINLMALGESHYDFRQAVGKQWQRIAHEVGHCLVHNPDLSGSPGSVALDSEDIYSEADIVGMDASAACFDLMGRHDCGPLFSAYYMAQLQYYSPDNVLDFDWSGSPLEFKVATHGTTQIVPGADGVTATGEPIKLCHIARVKICDGLYYYVEARQRGDIFGGIFDRSINVNNINGGAVNVYGGVVVTAVMDATVNNNQRMRFITILTDEPRPVLNPDPAAQTPVFSCDCSSAYPHLLKKDDTASDKPRGLRFKVIDAKSSQGRLMFHVRVEPVTPILGTQDGKFDLLIRHGSVSWESPDIYIDSYIPNEKINQLNCPLEDSQLPVGCGERPVVNRLNNVHIRVNYKRYSPAFEGTVKSRVTFCSIVPPGVGDNGIWKPEPPVPIALNINKDSGFAEATVQWVPSVGAHTCLKAYVDEVPGERFTDNNDAQENVCDFDIQYEDDEDSPMFIHVPVAIRNPLDVETRVHLSFGKMPPGFVARYPYSSVILGPREEQIYDLMIVPTKHHSAYLEEGDNVATVSIFGYIFGSDAGNKFPDLISTRMPSPIGGVTLRLSVKRNVAISLEGGCADNLVNLGGNIKPATGEEENIIVEVMDSKYRIWARSATASEGRAFNSCIDMSKTPQYCLDQDNVERRVIGKNRLIARAFINDSRTAAQADSGWIVLQGPDE